MTSATSASTPSLLVTQVTCPAGPDKENEDAAWIGDGVAVVVDGAGFPRHMRAGCSHSVSWYATHLAEAFGPLLSDRSRSAEDALSAAIGQVRDLHSDTCDLSAGSPSATVAAWRTSGDGRRLECLALCDASVIVVTPDGPRQVTDTRLETVTTAFVEERVRQDRADGRTVDGDRTREHKRWAVETSRNRPGGFWCAHHDPAAAHQSVQASYDLTDVRGIIAASDGATRAFDLLGTHTLDEFAMACLTGDLNTVVAAVRAAETTASPGLQDRGIKVNDDLTIVVARPVLT